MQIAKIYVCAIVSEGSNISIRMNLFLFAYVCVETCSLQEYSPLLFLSKQQSLLNRMSFLSFFLVIKIRLMNFNKAKRNPIKLHNDTN